jgi:adenylate cyclase
MLAISVINKEQNESLEHGQGPLELGRGPQRHVPRFVVHDHYVSRNQLLVEELSDGRVRMDNLSQTRPVQLDNGIKIDVGETCQVLPPIRLVVGLTTIDINQGPSSASQADKNFDERDWQTAAPPVHRLSESQQIEGLRALGSSPPPEKLTRWLETVLALFQSTFSSEEIYEQTARALVELVNLDLGLVLLRRGNGWVVAARHAASDRHTMSFSRTLVQYVAEKRRTFYQDWDSLHARGASLAEIESALVSPVFDLNGDVCAILYGIRDAAALARGEAIGLLEAQIVQLLAGAVGLNLTRSAAARTRIQFEQFFSSRLARELERNPKLLEGRNQEVSILVSDVRDFTPMSERLGPQVTFRLLHDLMERLSEPITHHGGVIVDYAGDGILAMWNAPVLQADHAHRACRAALDMLAELPALNAHWQKTVGSPLRIGIGINTGPALVGNTGSTRKFKYGPHGHTVNVTSRVQQATKTLKFPVLITTATCVLAAGAFETVPAGPVQVPGVTADLTLHELHGEKRNGR